jgi:hypothetical protein
METRSSHGAQLSGKVLRHSENQGDRGYFWERNSAIYLQSDMRFRFETETISSASGGGLSASSGGTSLIEGRWTIVEDAGQMHLLLRHDDGAETSFTSRNGGLGLQYLNGEAWNRYLIA